MYHMYFLQHWSVFLKYPKAIPLKYYFCTNPIERYSLPVSVEGQNPNLPASRHSWTNHMYIDQHFVTLYFPNATWAPLTLLPSSLILSLKLHMHIKTEFGSFPYYQWLLNKICFHCFNIQVYLSLTIDSPRWHSWLC